MIAGQREEKLAFEFPPKQSAQDLTHFADLRALAAAHQFGKALHIHQGFLLVGVVGQM